MNAFSDTPSAITACGSTAGPQEVEVSDEISVDETLVLPLHKRMVVQYATSETGATELRLFYGSKEISFDEPELFQFGETLAKQSDFIAGSATRWGAGYAWEKVKELFEHLVIEGVLQRGSIETPSSHPSAGRVQASPLPPATCGRPRSWIECEDITRELTGRAVELGYLELFVPIFRVAHIAMDIDGRHVGEANVFPRALRTEVPSTWMTCIYPGTRYMADAPMNVSALKSMREHWEQMSAALHRIRAAYLDRFPEAREGWTVGHLERLATAVLAVTSYPLMRCDRPVLNGQLHPALSSLFRVTDGMRMVVHQMLFVPFGESTMSPHDPVTSKQIFEYAERNYSFHSDTGVCAGPKHMVQGFLGILVDGDHADRYRSFSFDPQVEAALADVMPAIDYALLGLQAYAVTFSLWPLMTRTYEALAAIADAAVADGALGFSDFQARMGGHLRNLQTSPFLAKELWRVNREEVYADMYNECGRSLAKIRAPEQLGALIAPARTSDAAPLESELRTVLRKRLQCETSGEFHVEHLLVCLLDYMSRTQAILKEASATQGFINRLLLRAAPTRSFSSADMDVHNRLQGSEARRLPYLLDELEMALGIRFDIDAERLSMQAVPHAA